MRNGYNFTGRSYITVKGKVLLQSKIRRYGPPETVRRPDRRSEELDVYPIEDQNVRHNRTEAMYQSRF